MACFSPQRSMTRSLGPDLLRSVIRTQQITVRSAGHNWKLFCPVATSISQRNPYFGFRHRSTVSAANVLPGSAKATVAGVSQLPDLGKLPLPSLEKTLNKYMDIMQVVLNDKELQQLGRKVENFRENDGPKLQQLLEKRASSSQNWLHDWWTNAAYLQVREPLLTSSPAIMLPLLPSAFESDQQMLRYTAKFILAALSYRDALLAEGEHGYPVDKMGTTALCMSQYKRLFGACRVPAANQDEYHSVETSSNEELRDATHDEIVVLCRNTFYLINLRRSDVAVKNKIVVNHFASTGLHQASSERLTEDELFYELIELSEDSLHKPAAHGVGILTAGKRDDWSRTYKKLRRTDRHNKFILDKIQRSLFIVCIDADAEFNPTQNPKSNGMGQLLHGGGTHCASSNRWNDKTLQFIITRHGVCGLLQEHTPAEAVVPGRMLEFMQRKLQTVTAAAPAAAEGHLHSHSLGFSKDFKQKDVTELRRRASLHGEGRRRRLDFKLDDDGEILEQIQATEKFFDELVADVDLHVDTFDKFGKNVAKQHKISPDSFFQMALQLAFFRMHKTIAPTYETASMRRYALGRTETMRSATPAAKNFALAMARANDADGDDRLKALRTAVEDHRRRIGEAMEGGGIDRHLLGLKLIAAEENMPTPQIFSDPLHARGTHFRLSTSQIPLDFDGYTGYVPFTYDGYGVAYNIRQDSINYAVSSYKSCSETNSTRFFQAVSKALNDMRGVLDASSGENTEHLR